MFQTEWEKKSDLILHKHRKSSTSMRISNLLIFAIDWLDQLSLKTLISINSHHHHVGNDLTDLFNFIFFSDLICSQRFRIIPNSQSCLSGLSSLSLRTALLNVSSFPSTLNVWIRNPSNSTEQAFFKKCHLNSDVKGTRRSFRFSHLEWKS